MKSYQRVLKRVSWVGLIIGVFLGLYTGIGYLNRGIVGREARALWCLDSGGRIVDIDYITGCFALTQVPTVDKGFECTANPSRVWVRVIGGPWACYEYERLVQENPE